jgi:uncharacterized protein YdeI (YjbR/CyaY-like superfamily)
MPKTDKRIDVYIEKAQPFAQPILKHLRKLIHEGCPEVEETVKWGMPSFDYKGPFFSMAAFKNHAVFGFWKAKLLKDPKGYLDERKNNGGEAMGHGGRIESMKDLPPDKVLLDFIKQAKKLNDEGVKVPKKPAVAKRDLVVPDYFMAAVKRNKAALKTFENFSESQKREYVDWITEAKTDATREKRMETAIDWIAEGKIRNWKYVRK